VFVLLLLTALVPVLAVQVASSYRQYRERRARDLQLDVEAAREAVEAVEAYLGEVRRDAASTARAFVATPPAPRDRWNSVLARSIVDHPATRSLSWADDSGRIIASSDPSRIGQTLGQFPWSERWQGPRPWGLTDLIRIPGSGSGSFFVAEHVRDDAGVPRGVMVVEVAAEVLADRLVFHSMGTRRFSVVDGSGWLVYGYPPEPLPWEARNLGARYPKVTEVLHTGVVQTGSGWDPVHRERHLFAILPLPSLGWAIAVAHPEAEVVRPVVLGLLQDAGIVGLAALISFLLAAAAARRVSAPVERLGEFAHAVGQGQFELHSEVRGLREVRRLALALNRMADQLQGRQREHDRVLELERERVREARILEAMQEHTETLLAYLDGELRFRQINTAYCRFLGHRREEVIGLHYSEVSDSREVLDLITRVRDTGETVEMHEFRRPAGKHPYIGPSVWDIAFVPVRNEAGEVEGVVISSTQITQQLAARDDLVTAEREHAQAERERAQAERARAGLAETVAAETNHRMKNNLALISGLLQLQLYHEPRESATARALREAIGRITALAAVHEQLYTEQPGRVELRAMLERVAQSAVRSLAGTEVALSVEGAEMHVSPKAGSMLAVVANEMITNALKHGAPAEDGKRHVDVSLALQNGRLVLRVWNSGPPVPEGFSPGAQSGMGLRLLQDLGGQVDGGVSLRPVDGGTLCEVTMRADALDLTLPHPARHGWEI